MRARSIALVSATLAVALVAAGCGGDDEPTAQSSTPAASTPATPPTETGGTEVPQTGTTDDDTPQTGDDPTEPPIASTEPSGDTAAEAIAKNSDLTSLKTALGAAGLESVLNQPGPYTVFAPNNDAFAKLGSQLDTLLQPAAKSDLANRLKFHVVSGELKVKDLKDDELLTTLQGTRLRVSVKGNTVTIGNSLGKAAIVSADTDASNGIIHLVDTVLTPKD